MSEPTETQKLAPKKLAPPAKKKSPPAAAAAPKTDAPEAEKSAPKRGLLESFLYEED